MLHFAVSPLDYHAVSTLLTFESCSTRQCIDITIVNDSVKEGIESFFVRLQRTSDLDPRITLNTTSAVVEITEPTGLWDMCSIPFMYNLKFIQACYNESNNM